MKDYKQVGISRGGIGYEEKLSNFRGNFECWNVQKVNERMCYLHDTLKLEEAQKVFRISDSTSEISLFIS